MNDRFQGRIKAAKTAKAAKSHSYPPGFAVHCLIYAAMDCSPRQRSADREPQHVPR